MRSIGILGGFLRIKPYLVNSVFERFETRWDFEGLSENEAHLGQ